MPSGYILDYTGMSQEEYRSAVSKIESIACMRPSENAQVKKLGFIVEDGFDITSLGKLLRDRIRPATIHDPI